MKFRYILRNKNTGKMHKKVYTLSQIQEKGLGHLFDLDNYEITSTDLFSGLIDKNKKEVYFGDDIISREFENNGMFLFEKDKDLDSFELSELKGNLETEFKSKVKYSDGNFYLNESDSVEVPLCLYFGNQKFSQPIFEIEVLD